MTVTAPSNQAIGFRLSGNASFDVQGKDGKSIDVTISGQGNATGAEIGGTNSTAKLNLIANKFEVTSSAGEVDGLYLHNSGAQFTGSIGNLTVNANNNAYAIHALKGATVSVDINSLNVHSNAQTAYGIYAADSGGSSVDISSRDDSKAQINVTSDVAGNGVGVYAYDTATVNLTNVSVSADKAGDIGSGSFLNLTSSDLLGAVSNDGTLNFVGGTNTISGDLTGTGSADIASGATLALKNSNIALSGDITNSGTLNFAEGANTLKDSTVSGSGTTSVSENAILTVNGSTISQNLENAGTLVGSNVSVGGSLTNDGTATLSNATIGKSLTNNGTATLNNVTTTEGWTLAANSVTNTDALKNVYNGEQYPKTGTVRGEIYASSGTLDLRGTNLWVYDTAKISGGTKDVPETLDTLKATMLYYGWTQGPAPEATTIKNIVLDQYTADQRGALGVYDGTLTVDTISVDDSNPDWYKSPESNFQVYTGGYKLNGTGPISEGGTLVVNGSLTTAGFLNASNWIYGAGSTILNEGAVVNAYDFQNRGRLLETARVEGAKATANAVMFTNSAYTELGTLNLTGYDQTTQYTTGDLYIASTGTWDKTKYTGYGGYDEAYTKIGQLNVSEDKKYTFRSSDGSETHIGGINTTAANGLNYYVTDSATVSINEDKSKAVKLNGDIVFASYSDSTSDNAKFALNLSTADSYLTGAIKGTVSATGKPTGWAGNPVNGDETASTDHIKGMTLNMSNGATWTATDDSFVNYLTAKDSVISGDHTVTLLNAASMDNMLVAGNIANNGTLTGSNITLNGGIKNDGGNVDITVQSVSTDSGVDTGLGNAAVYATNGGKTYISSSANDSRIAISGEGAGTIGIAAKDSAEVSVSDVKTISAIADNSHAAVGVYSYNYGDKINLTNVGTIKAEGGYATGLSSHGGFIGISGGNTEISAVGDSSGAEGIELEIGGETDGTVVSLDVDTITASASGDGVAYGVLANLRNEDAVGIIKAKTIGVTANEEASAYGVSCPEQTKGTINVTVADTISVESNVYAVGIEAPEDNGTIDVTAGTISVRSNAVALGVCTGEDYEGAVVVTANTISVDAGEAGLAFGVMPVNGTINLNNVKNINVHGGDGSSAIYVMGGELNISNDVEQPNLNVNGNVINAGTLNVNSGDININGDVANNSGFNIKSGTTTVNGSLTGEGTTTISEDATLAFTSSTSTDHSQNTVETYGTIDLRDNKVGTTLTVDTFSALGDKAKINFDADISGSGETASSDSIVVSTLASGDITLGSVNVTSDDATFETQQTKTLTLFEKQNVNTNFSNLNIKETITATSGLYKYVFTQDENNRGNLVATREKTATLPEIIQNQKGAGTIATYSLLSDYAETEDLGTLTRVSADVAREFTINGNDHTFTSDKKQGITVNNGDTLNLTNLASFNGFNGNAVTNAGTLNVTSSDNIGSLSNSGTLNFVSGTNTVTGSVANAGNLNVAADTTTISGDLVGTGSADIASGATLALKNSKVELSGNITNAGTLNFAAGTNTLKDSTVTGSGKTTVSENANLTVNSSTISQNLENAGTLVGSNVSVGGSLTNSGTATLSNATIGKSLTNNGTATLNNVTTTEGWTLAEGSKTYTDSLTNGTDLTAMAKTGTVNGNVYASSGTLDLRGVDLRLKGDALLSGGTEANPTTLDTLKATRVFFGDDTHDGGGNQTINNIVLENCTTAYRAALGVYYDTLTVDNVSVNADKEDWYWDQQYQNYNYQMYTGFGGTLNINKSLTTGEYMNAGYSTGKTGITNLADGAVVNCVDFQNTGDVTAETLAAGNVHVNGAGATLNAAALNNHAVTTFGTVNLEAHDVHTTASGGMYSVNYGTSADLTIGTLNFLNNKSTNKHQMRVGDDATTTIGGLTSDSSVGADFYVTGDSVTTVNKDGGNAVQYTGDIVFTTYADSASDGAKFSINLDSSNDYFTGAVKGTTSASNRWGKWGSAVNSDATARSEHIKGMTLNMSKGSTWTVTDDSFVNNLTVDNSTITGAGKTVTIGNSGVFKKANIAVNVANDGTASFTAGTTTISGDLTGTGSADIASEATLALQNSNVSMSGDITNNGELKFTAGTNTLKDSTVAGSGTTSVSSGTSLDVSNSTILQNFTNSGTLNFVSGANTVTGNVANEGNLNVSAGTTTISGDLTGTGTTTVMENATLAFENAKLTSQDISNSGTVKFAAGSSQIDRLSIGGLTSIANSASASFADSVLQNLENYGLAKFENTTVNGTFTNSGTANIDGAAAFEKDVENTGTLNVNSAATVNGALNLTNGTTTVNNGGSLTVAESWGNKRVTFSSTADSFVINDGGSFTVDAFSGNVLSNDFSVLAEAGNAISADVNGVIGLRIAKTGEALKNYTLEQYKTVQNALYGEDTDNKGKLSFINGNLTGSRVVIKVNTATGERKDNNFDAVDTNTNKTLQIEGGYTSDPIEVVQDTEGAAPELQAVKGVNFTQDNSGNGVSLTGKQLKVKAIADGASAVTLSVSNGSTLNLTGGENTEDSLVLDENDKALATDLVVENGTIGIAGLASAAKQQGTLRNVTVNNGTHILGVSSDAATNIPQTNYIYEKLSLNNDNSQVNVLNSALQISTLEANNGTIFVDPAYFAVENVANSTISTDLLVSKGSVVNLGNMDAGELKSIVSNDAGMTATAKLSGFTVANDETVLALNDNYTLAEGANLIVDAAVENNGKRYDGTSYESDVYFGNKSLLVVNGRTASQGAALKLNGQSVTVEENAKLYIAQVQALKTYTIFDNANGTSEDIKGWQEKGSTLFASKLLDDFQVVRNDGTAFVISVGGYNPTPFADTIPYNSIKAMADLGLVDTEADLETKAGIRFLSRATDSTYLADAAMKPTLNEVSTISTTAAIQHAALRATDAMTDAVTEHMSTTLRANDSEIHDGDTTDVWATPFYRSMSWSGGGNDADGYMSGFSFGIDKHAGKNARYGLAMHYGTGSTDSDGAKTDTTNSSKAIGVSLYGSKQWGKLNVMGQIGYTDYDNTMSSYLPSTMNMPTITASPNASTFTADVRAERAYKSGTIDITPHAGVRYTRVMSDSFKTYLSETQSDSQNIVQFPVGVTFGVQRNAADGWKLKGLLDLAVVPVAGNKDAHTSVLFTGINNVWNDADTAILDSCSFRGSIGFTAERNYFSSNLGYALQTSSNETNHTFRLWLNWKLK